MATIKFRGNDMQTNGDVPQPGETAPDFKLVANDLSPVTLADTAGKIRIVSVVPSVDTPVCSIETARFNKELDSLSDNVVGYTVSVDTPFAQKRWCAAEGVEKMKLLSDFKGHKMIQDYGLYLADIGISARCVFVIDGNGKVAYTQLVPEVTHEPDYAAVLDEARKLAS